MREYEYMRDKAVSYAERWAHGRNPAYYNFDGLGGDCTNFLSQCLFSGAGVMNYTQTFGWYYNNLQSRSPSWTGVEYFYNFLVGNGNVGPFGREVDAEYVKPGDFVQLGNSAERFYHSLIITQIRGGILLGAAHTYDVLNVPVYQYNAVFYRYIHIEGYRE